MADDIKNVMVSGTVISNGAGVKVRWHDGSMEAISYRFAHLFEGIQPGATIEVDLEIEYTGQDYLITDIRSVTPIK